MQYILLLRSVNLGKLRKVSNARAEKRLAALGYENVTKLYQTRGTCYL